jgi:integral membrane sensor domain MASE1
MNYFERTRVLRIKTIYALVLTVIFFSVAAHSAIDYLAPEFMLKHSMLSMAVALLGMSASLGFGMYFLATDPLSPQREVAKESANA